ncbi:hypothetical protein [Gulosibacter bifidus]|uniref:Cell division protein FtsL n=1 Tax=Gulosibacter bifidus TaxID=272239 RepID=A0ABW5RFA0_9MICO|nr:hypothetical protein [Gulosibacter bifidus]
MSALTQPITAVPSTAVPARETDRNRRAHLRLVESIRERTVMSRRKLVIFIGTVLGVVVLQLALATVTMQDAYRAESLKKERLELQRERTAAIEQSDAAASPQQLAERATEIGMVPSAGFVYLDVQTGAIQGDSAMAGQAAAPIDPSLVENKAAEAIEAEHAKDPKKKDGSGASQAKPAKPAVPSEFELRSPETH